MVPGEHEAFVRVLVREDVDAETRGVADVDVLAQLVARALRNNATLLERLPEVSVNAVRVVRAAAEERPETQDRVVQSKRAPILLDVELGGLLARAIEGARFARDVDAAREHEPLRSGCARRL